MSMTYYIISSVAGPVYGIYAGKNEREAFSAMVADGGPSAGMEGDAGDWIISPLVGACAADVMAACEAADFPADQDWGNEATTWTLPDSSQVRVSGAAVEVIRADA